MKYIKALVSFVIGIILSYLTASLFNDGSVGVFAAVCFFGALIYSEISEKTNQGLPKKEE